MIVCFPQTLTADLSIEFLNTDLTTKTIIYIFRKSSPYCPQTVSVLAGCEGRAPGYYAEPQSECRTYLLCVKENRAEGLHFNCPPGESD